MDRHSFTGRQWGLDFGRLHLNGFSGYLGFGTVGILVNHPLKHHPGLFVVLESCVGLPDLQRRGCQFLTQRIIGHDVVERVQRLLVPSHTELTLTDPILGIRGQRGLSVQFEEQTKTRQCGFIIPVFELFHHAVVKMTRSVLNLCWSGQGPRGLSRDQDQTCENSQWNTCKSFHRSASMVRGLCQGTTPSSQSTCHGRGRWPEKNRCNNGCFLVRSNGPLIDTRPYTTSFVRPGGLTSSNGLFHMMGRKR